MNAPRHGGVVDSDQPGGLSRLHLLARKIEAGMQAFKPEISEFTVHQDKIQFAITAEALFSPGSELLKPESEPILNRVAGILQSVDANIMIEAHTDDLPPDNPNFETNWELSAVRAAKVVRYFVEGHNFDPGRVTAVGQAEFRPVASNQTPEGRAKNRRVTFYIIPDAENRMGFRSPASEGVPAHSSSH
jgi:chemotaxis protein MotB